MKHKISKGILESLSFTEDRLLLFGINCREVQKKGEKGHLLTNSWNIIIIVDNNIGMAMISILL